ncbi:MAG TPA: ATP-binding cassette domain-containing protein [Acetobacteraceae bacterium]|nr:ATP-binding cassette domain-containing protein [Acetobacteraceae bacterium]
MTADSNVSEPAIVKRPAEKLIEIVGLSKRFAGFTAVDNVSFDVARGEVLGFLGPNGAGKSTTMRMLAGFMTPSAGTARICGHDVREDSLAARASMGFLPEGAPTYPEMTVLGFLRFVARIRGYRGGELADRVDHAVALTTLAGVRLQPIETLSKGFKRRVGLAQALLHDPQVLVLDEPTDGLDPNQKHEVRTLIARMAPEKAIVISTHILEEVEAVCTRAIIIAGGRVVADATPVRWPGAIHSTAWTRCSGRLPILRRRPEMRNVLIVARRELGGYFATPVAVVFIVIFLALQGALTFNLGNFFARDQADLVPFFNFIPWVFLLLVPAITMRLWAEERRLGTIELLLTLPIAQWQAVLGKFLAAWGFCAIALLLTFPFVITVNYLGAPDNGVIASGYLGALLVAGAFLSVGAALSAVSRNQVIAFVLAVSVCFIFAVASYPVVTDFLSRNVPVLAEVARRMSVTERFMGFTRGVIALRDIIFFASFIGFWLFVNTVIVEHRKAD